MIKKIINIKQLPLHLQKAIRAEASNLNLKSKRKVVAATELSEEAKVWLDQVVRGTWAQRPDGKIDVSGNVEALSDSLIQDFMGKEISFGEVGGDFICRYTNITSLEGAPEKVGGDFDCRYIDITSLEGAPRKVGGDFICSSTNITSLKGAPREVGGDFDCRYTNITSLEGAPEKVGGDFYCSSTNITSLKGAPREVGGDFYCSYTKIISLEGAPEKVGGNFVYTSTPYAKKEPEKLPQEDDFEDDEVEFALYDLIDDTEKFYRFDEEEDLIKRKTSSIKAYIRSKLFSQVTSIKGLEIFLEDPEFSVQSAFDASSFSSGTSMIDDENWTDFLEDMKEAARKRIRKLQNSK